MNSKKIVIGLLTALIALLLIGLLLSRTEHLTNQQNAPQNGASPLLNPSVETNAPSSAKGDMPTTPPPNSFKGEPPAVLPMPGAPPPIPPKRK